MSSPGEGSRAAPACLQGNKMHVLFVPDFSHVNAYQRELAKALERLDARVSMSDGVGAFPLLGAMQACGKPDVLHLHWTHQLMVSTTGSIFKTLVKSTRFALELPLLRARGTVVIWTVHNLASHERSNWRIELLFNRICVRQYDYLILHCHSARETVARTYCLPDKLTARMVVIPHGSYVDSYANSITGTEARARFGYGEQDLVFLFFGLIRPYKGVLDLISAFNELKHPQAQLLIAGNPVDDEIKRSVQDQLRATEGITARLGFIPDDEIQLYMNASDVVVLPHQHVLMPGSAVLAMSFGKPVIAPDVGCVGELLDDRGGFLYTPDQQNALLCAMRQALNANLPAMGEHNLQRAKLLDWDNIAQRTYDLYQRCLA
jgi:beta-1,4-mannosyltransferase